MSTETTPKPIMGKVTKKELYQAKPGPVYLHNGKSYDLREINDATAEALANDPKCKFLQFKDPSKRPKDQVMPFAPEEPAKSAPPAKP